MGEVTVRRSPDAPEFASWAKGYLIAAVLALFGLLPQLLGGGGTIDEVERNCRALVAQGKPIEARVSRKWGDANYQSLEYTFVLDGKTYGGLSDPGSREWTELSIGDTIQATYLPSDPNITEYRPERWLQRQENAGKTGWIISGVGVAALLLTGIADLMRRRGARLPDAVRGDGRFLGLAIGLLFFAVGMFFQLQILSGIMSGTPIPFTVRSGGNVVSQGFAEGWQLWLVALFPVPFWGIGIYFLSKWRAE